MKILTFLYVLLLIQFLFSCAPSGTTDSNTETQEISMDSISEQYVKLVLELGKYIPDFVDAYYGPEAWKIVVDSIPVVDSFPADQFLGRVGDIQDRLNSLDQSKLDSIVQQRHRFLLKQLQAVETKIKMQKGISLTFDEESKLLYDAVSPTHTALYYEKLLSELDRVLPGKGPVSERLNNFKANFIIPKEKLDTVFKVAIAEARRRTAKHFELPEGEEFRLEFVTDKPWSGYNWYQGDYHSLIQINTDLPIYIDRAVDLAAHEGYPGHHVFNVTIEQNLVNGRGWKEFTIYPLFSPQSLLAEGSANFGKEVAFPGTERIAFEKEYLFPLAGLDSSQADEYYDIHSLFNKLSYAGNEAARNYLEGKFSKQEAIDWLVKYALMTPERATQRVSFFEKYRSYVINYNLGLDMVKNHIELQGGTAGNPEKRWELFYDLISRPVTPSELMER